MQSTSGFLLSKILHEHLYLKNPNKKHTDSTTVHRLYWTSTPKEKISNSPVYNPGPSFRVNRDSISPSIHTFHSHTWS